MTTETNEEKRVVWTVSIRTEERPMSMADMQQMILSALQESGVAADAIVLERWATFEHIESEEPPEVSRPSALTEGEWDVLLDEIQERASTQHSHWLREQFAKIDAREAQE